MGKEYKATADYLADSLSKKTGTHFEVLRGRVRLDSRKPETVIRYGLRATRGEWNHTFQCGRPMKLQDLNRWLASINDMVAMGFIPVLPPE